MHESLGARGAIEILLVEDSPTDRMLALEALQHARILNVVQTVADGVDALDYLRRNGKFAYATRPDLILLDLNLPRKDGREVLAEIKADPLLRSIPVVVMTMSDDEEDIARAYQQYANGYIKKPLDIAGFSRAVSALGNYWFTVVSLPDAATAERYAQAVRPPTIPPSSLATAQAVQVLLIEDSPSDALLVAAALRESSLFSFEVTSIRGLADARPHLADKRFDVILTDLGLPESQGMDTYRRLTRIAPDIPVIVLTGLEDESVGIAALREGAHDYLVKGQLSGRALARAIRYAIDKGNILAQLTQSQRLEAVGQLAAGVAHDFNNVLGIVKGHATLLREESQRDVLSSANEILQAVQHATQLTRQLLAFSRKQATSMASIDLSEVVANFSNMLRRVIGGVIGLELQFSQGLPSVLADAGMIEQVVLNLALNARDAMPAGGKLTLRTDPVVVDTAAALLHPRAYPGAFVCLRVRDTGCGMPPGILPRIWEPFFTTKDVGKGSGLGLATVYGIVEQHQGWIAVSSTQGVGTWFDIYFPVTTVVRENKTPRNHVVPVGGTELLLLVEDNDPLRFLAKTILEMRGYEIIEARTAAEAMYCWKQHAGCVDVLVTDLSLPDGMTGLQLAEELRCSSPQLPIVFVSGYGSEIMASGRAKFLLDHGCAFLQKPYTPEALVALVRATLDERTA